MIKIDKSSITAPASLTNEVIQAKLDLIWNGGMPNKNLIESGIYRADDVVKSLSKLYNDKCAYCETHDPQFEVEHYRPKKLIAVEDRSLNQNHFGYYWLSYEWTNLMPGCHDCNKNGVKGNRFPTASIKKNVPDISGANVILKSNNFSGKYLLDETPIFLNPEESDFDPFKYFKFDLNGFMDPMPEVNSFDYIRSDTTIKVFQLNREKIFATYRKWNISKIIKRIDLLFIDLLAKEIVYSYFKKKYFEILDEVFLETKPERQYSFFWKYFYQNIDIFIMNHINSPVSEFIKPLTMEYKAKNLVAFNELNSVEHYIINQLSGVNLNSNLFEDDKANYGGQWQYKSAAILNRSVNEVLIEQDLTEALIRLNPEISAKHELAEEVIYKLRAILISVNQIGLVKANEEFFKWLIGDKTMPFGENNRHVPIRVFDFENLSLNVCIITNQLRIHHRETKIPDIVLYINGIPVVIGEAKTPIRPSVSWLDGAYEIHEVYENTIPQLFVPNILSFATEGKSLYYGSIRCPLDFWAPWRLEDDGDNLARRLGLGEIGKEMDDLLNPGRLLDILRNFSLFTTNKKKHRSKIIPRFQQYEGANKIVDRVKEGRVKKGLIWHFQGSGKSLLMVFAAQKLRRAPELKSPTVIVLVDRTDLDTQISGTFNASDIPNVEATESIRDLQQLLEQDTRKIIISMIHKFRDSKPNMNMRDNIIVLVDEAHRTQEGDLGRQMRAALPNAFLFGLTGTPVNKADKNTFWAFGSEEDEGGYLSRYTFQDSIRDGATLPLHFEPRLLDVHVDKETIDKLFEEFKEESALTDEEADALNKKSAKMAAFLKSPERVSKIVEDISIHFKEKVAPHGFKAMIVTPDREACVQYKIALDAFFPSEASKVVISTTANDPLDFKQKWGVDKSQQERIVDEYNDPISDLQFLIVTAKLLTGFDAPILQTLYLDKSIKDHTLLQAICRTNRLFPNKSFGRIVDYFGVFDNAAKALEFDEASVKQIISNLSELRSQLPLAVKDALGHFENVDRNIIGFEGLEAAQNAIKTDDKKDAFAKDYKFLSKLWESLSPDNILNLYQADYKWLSQVFESVRPASDNVGKLLWMTLGAQTTKLIHDNIHVGDIHNLEEFILDADVIEDIFNNPDPKNAKKLTKVLISRFKKYGNHPNFKKLSDLLEELRDKAEKGLITSIEFVKELCKIAKETVQAEKDLENEIQEKTPKTALTELFLELKTDQTPAVVERIVADIDAIVRIVRFPGWQKTSSGERDVQSSLRKALLKYQLHKDQLLFDRAYSYIKVYY